MKQAVLYNDVEDKIEIEGPIVDTDDDTVAIRAFAKKLEEQHLMWVVHVYRLKILEKN